MTNVVIAASLVIAGCSLAVSVTGGVNERKRPFSLLRLTGVPLGVLRRVVALEAAVPLLIISVLSAAMGFLAAGLFLNAQLGYTLRATRTRLLRPRRRRTGRIPRHHRRHPPAHRAHHRTRGRPQRITGRRYHARSWSPIQ